MTLRNSCCLVATACLLFGSHTFALRLKADATIQPHMASEVASVGSLPPPNPMRSKVESTVPFELLPSTLNVVTHEAQFGEDVPALRADCLRMLGYINTSASAKNRMSPAFSAFTTMIGILAANDASPDETNLDSNAEYNKDKKITYALDLLSHSAASSGSSLDWHYQASLRNCAIEKGRTIFMELVRRGYTRSINNVHSRKLSSVAFHLLKDTDNNNLVHLAVMSRSVSIVTTVLTLLTPVQIVELLEENNVHGMKPIDISNSQLTEDIGDALKNSYSVSQSAVKMQEMNAAMLKRLSGGAGKAGDVKPDAVKLPAEGAADA